MKFLGPFNPKYWVVDEPKMSVPPGPQAIFQARCSAIALEADRELYADLMRWRREKQTELSRIDAALEEMDVLRILERAS
jgi:hypothetical protein